MGEFAVGDRVRIKPESAIRPAPGGGYGHVIAVGGLCPPRHQGLIWVRDRNGGEWGLPAYQLEHID